MDNLLNGKVMIVDDDETVILPVEMSLQEKKIETISFSEPEKALEYLRNNKVSIILLDYHMEPHINGDEFIKRLREFDKETIVYLQTAYSEELPAIDMLEKYQIQGYIDKGKKDEERMQLIVSALKQAQLIELVKKQQKEIEARTYKEEFLGKFLGILMGEIKEKSFSVMGSVECLSSLNDSINTEIEQDFNRYINNIKSSIQKLNELIETLELNNTCITAEGIKETLKRLFHVICSVKSIELSINVQEKDRLMLANSKNIIYILTDIIEYLVNTNEKNININIEVENDKNVIKIQNEINNSSVLEKINKLSVLDENISIVNNGSIIIYC